MEREAWWATVHGVGERSLVGYNPWGSKRLRQDLATKQQQQMCVFTHILRLTIKMLMFQNVNYSLKYIILKDYCFCVHLSLVCFFRNLWRRTVFWGFPDSSVGKESTCNAGDPGSIPGSGRSHGEGIGYPLQYSWASLVAQLVRNTPEMQETWD